MFVTEKLVNKIIDIERLLCKLSYNSQPFSITQKFMNQALTSETITFLNIYGINISAKQLAKIKRELTPLASDTIHHLVRNFENVNKFIKSINDKVLTLSVLQQLHKTISANLFDYWDLGRLRNKNDLPQITIETSHLKIPEKLTPPEDIAKLLTEISNLPWIFAIFTWLKKYPQILPFSLNNVGIYYLTPKLILAFHDQKAAGFIPTISIVKQFLIESKATDTEETKLQLLTDLFAQQISTISKLINSRHSRSVQKELNLNYRQLKVINFLKRHRKITRAYYSKHFNVSFMTAYRDLNQLAKLGIVERKGSGKSTFYVYKT